jgi:AmmeMemoRadiSam system protein A
MDDSQRRRLLQIAKEAVSAAVCGRARPEAVSDDPALNEPCGCFVTLKNGRTLRGCIGQFTSTKPLIELIVEMATASATSDPRFLTDPIQPNELEQLDLEISVLSPLEETDDPLSLQLGVHGIYIKQGGAAGCFLPQVATETGWSKEQFLSFCCSHKAGLPADAWRDPQTDVLLFTAEVFGADYADI